MTTATHRFKLDDPRAGFTHKVHIGRLTGYITVNADEQGAPREVFIHGFGGFGSTLQGFCDTFAIMLSISLQHGVTLHTLAGKFGRMTIEPNGETDNPEIPWCWSIPDYIVTLLVHKFGTTELIHETEAIRRKDDRHHDH